MLCPARIPTEPVMTTRLSRILMLVVALFCLLPSAPRWSQAQDHKPDVKARPAGRAYELRLAHLKAAAIAIRFNAETGESWLFAPDPLGSLAWAKIKDSNRP